MNTSFNEHINNLLHCIISIHRNYSGILSKLFLCCPDVFSCVPYPLNCIDETLSVSPYGSWTNGHDRDISPINNQQRDLEIRDDSHLFNDDLVIVWTDTPQLFPFVSRYFTCPRSDHLVSPYLSSISFLTSTLLLVLWHNILVNHSRACKLC